MKKIQTELRVLFLIERKINLLLIGKGDWALKLQKIFSNQEFNIICKIVGAREFIESRDLQVVNNIFSSSEPCS